jgi:hypothetical protein
MFAMQTSLLRTAPAKAARGDGIGMPAIPARAWRLARHAQYRAESEPFRNRSDMPAIGSVGAMVI